MGDKPDFEGRTPDGRIVVRPARPKNAKEAAQIPTYIVPLVDGEAELLAPNMASYQHLGWSPDGSKFAYVTDGDFELVQAASHSHRRLTAGRDYGDGYNAGSVSWSRDGK